MGVWRSWFHRVHTGQCTIRYARRDNFRLSGCLSTDSSEGTWHSNALIGRIHMKLLFELITFLSLDNMEIYWKDS